MAAGVGGTAGVAVSGAGAWAQNIILTDTLAYILNSEVESHTFVDIDAINASSIDAVIVAASLAAAGGGTAGVGASIGISIADNTIGANNDLAQLHAYIENATVNAKAGALTINADGDQSINAIVVKPTRPPIFLPMPWRHLWRHPLPVLPPCRYRSVSLSLRTELTMWSRPILSTRLR